MKQDRMRMRRSMDIGRVKRLLDSGKSEAEVYEEFETWYNRRGKNPWWSDKAPDVSYCSWNPYSQRLFPRSYCVHRTP